jgi:hypothetical protein
VLSAIEEKAAEIAQKEDRRREALQECIESLRQQDKELLRLRYQMHSPALSVGVPTGTVAASSRKGSPKKIQEKSARPEPHWERIRRQCRGIAASPELVLPGPPNISSGTIECPGTGGLVAIEGGKGAASQGHFTNARSGCTF